MEVSVASSPVILSDSALNIGTATAMKPWPSNEQFVKNWECRRSWSSKLWVGHFGSNVRKCSKYLGIYAASSLDELQDNPEIRSDLFHGFRSGVNLTGAA